MTDQDKKYQAEERDYVAKPVKSGTELLLEQATKVEEAKALKIQELLVEKSGILDRAMARIEEIKLELKALGYHPLRKKKSEETLDKSQATS